MFFGPRTAGRAEARTRILNYKILGGGRIHFARAKEKTGSPAGPEEPLGRHDHAMDEIRYFAMSLKEQEPLAAEYVERMAF